MCACRSGGGGLCNEFVVSSDAEISFCAIVQTRPAKLQSANSRDAMDSKTNNVSIFLVNRREKQYQCFCKLVKVYETEPDNVAKLMDLMQQVQEFGQPPPEIIQEIAPGVELDEEGLPKLDASGMPLNGECCVM